MDILILFFMDSLVKLFLFFKFRIDHELRPLGWELGTILLGIVHHLYISLPVAERGEDDPNAYSCLVRSRWMDDDLLNEC